MIDPFIEAQEKYENCTVKPHIETQLNMFINSLFEHNLKFKLVQWRYFKDDPSDIDAARNRNANNQIYLKLFHAI